MLIFIDGSGIKHEFYM